MNFAFDLFRFDFWRTDSLFQISLGTLVGQDNRERSLFCLWYRRGEAVCVDLLWLHVCRRYLEGK